MADQNIINESIPSADIVEYLSNTVRPQLAALQAAIEAAIAANANINPEVIKAVKMLEDALSPVPGVVMLNNGDTVPNYAKLYELIKENNATIEGNKEVITDLVTQIAEFDFSGMTAELNQKLEAIKGEIEASKENATLEVKSLADEKIADINATSDSLKSDLSDLKTEKEAELIASVQVKLNELQTITTTIVESVKETAAQVLSTIIDDANAADDKTYSSNKIGELINPLATKKELSDLNKAFSEAPTAEKIETIINEKLSNLEGIKGDKGDAGENAIIGTENKGDYDISENYNKGDIVIYDNKIFIAKEPSTGVEPPMNEPSNDSWMLLLFQGAKGDKGEKGDRGEQGIQGPRGETGLTGAQGDHAVAGLDFKGAYDNNYNYVNGDLVSFSGALWVAKEQVRGVEPSLINALKWQQVSLIGARGEKGEQGLTGLTGPQGEKGEKGDQGERGEKGFTGDTGPQGLQGNPGPQGEQGIQGIKGDTGIQGIQGIQGPRGEQAIAALNPRGNYDNTAQYVKGDYVTHSDGNAYVCKVELSQGTAPTDGSNNDPNWQILALRGAQGDQGVQGVQGPQGNTGPEGQQGPRGEQGIQGVTGPKGDTGKTGPRGEQGIQGERGEKGLTGDSAYQIWLNAGNTGSEEQFLDSLKAIFEPRFMPPVIDGLIDNAAAAGDKTYSSSKIEADFQHKNKANGSRLVAVSGNVIDLSEADNFKLAYTSGALQLNNGVEGQTGTIIVTNATNLLNYASNIKWRVKPQTMTANEVLCYFVVNANDIRIGRV